MKPSLKLHAALRIKGVVLKGDVRNQCDVEEAIEAIIIKGCCFERRREEPV